VSNVRVGTSGWHYPTGRGRWDGVFYPARRGRGTTFDELAYYAAHFDTVEVNSTFYGQPRAEVTRGWAERTPAGFEFSVKLYQKFTHPEMFKGRLRRAAGVTPDRKGARGVATGDGARTFASGEGNPQDDLLDALVRPNGADIDEFKRGIDPLADAGKLAALLAQFPPSFKNGDAERAYLADLLRAFSVYPVAVELRHRSWSDGLRETLELLDAFEAAFVHIDEPKFRFSIRQSHLPDVRGFYYMRLHGRNAANWWRHEKAEDRYDYLYSADELKEFTDIAGAARELVKRVYMYANNHFSAKSVANAAMIKHQLGETVEGEYPEAFVTRYPELRFVVKQRSATAERRLV
jgi:uncharacterized protein YecE (DUF72 family)